MSLGALARLLVALALLVPHLAAAQQGQPAEQRRTPAAPQGAPIDYAGVIASQPRLVDEVLAGLEPSDPSVPSTYFVGFSAWSDQDVFIREVAQARDIVDARLGTMRRSLLLVNHVMALEEVPLASVTNLDNVLTRLGRIMDPAKDTLILFISSHGVEGILGVHFPPFPLLHLTPARLRAMLDRSGISNRIVIISACHSGSFVPALRHPRTLLLTAARADRSSFGCDHRNDWTFFGNALFNRALRETTSLVDAFRAARTIIAGWEAKDRLLPSEPQIFIGEEIGPVIDRLAGRAPPADAPSPCRIACLENEDERK